MRQPLNTAVLDGIYDRLLDENLSVELASLIETNQASIQALPAEERSHGRDIAGLHGGNDVRLRAGRAGGQSYRQDNE